LNYQSTGTTTLTAGTPITIGNFNQSNGTLVDGGSYIYVGYAATSTWTKTGGTFTSTGYVDFYTGAASIGASTFNTLAIEATTTVNYYGSSQTVSAETYGHLTLSGSGTKTPAAGTITVAGDFTLATGVTYAGTTNNPAVNLAGNFSNSGTFNSGTGTFTFNG